MPLPLRLRAAVPAALALWVALPAPAQACSYIAAFRSVEPRGEGTDGSAEAPEMPVLSLHKIRRGTGPVVLPDGSVMVSSCDDIGVLEIRFDTHAAGLAYELEVEGTLPDDLRLPSDLVEPSAKPGESTWVHWADGATDDQEPFDFTLTVYAVDADGQRSQASKPLRIADPGREAEPPPTQNAPEKGTGSGAESARDAGVADDTQTDESTPLVSDGCSAGPQAASSVWMLLASLALLAPVRPPRSRKRR